MSYSNIIKLHNLRPQKVVVGQAPAKTRQLTPAPQIDQQDDVNRSECTEQEPIDEAQMLVVRAEAENIVATARGEAEVILQEAMAEAEQMRLQAQQQGYEKGYAEALDTARTGVLESIGRIAEMAKNTTADMSSILNTLEEGVVDLALSIAEKVVHKRLEEDRSLILSMVEGALQYVDVIDVLRIRINPEDMGILRTHWDQGHIDIQGRNIDLIADSRVQLGGCIIDTKDSIIDAQVETKLAEIDRAFRAELDGSMR